MKNVKDLKVNFLWGILIFSLCVAVTACWNSRYVVYQDVPLLSKPEIASQFANVPADIKAKSMVTVKTSETDIKGISANELDVVKRKACARGFLPTRIRKIFLKTNEIEIYIETLFCGENRIVFYKNGVDWVKYDIITPNQLQELER
jgi:hypothetical protein